VQRAAEALQAGELVVIPTDTLYGLAADAFSLAGTARVFDVKERDIRLPLPVLVRSQKQLIGLTPTIPAAAEALMAAFWPGPLTLVIPAESGLQWDLGHTEGTVAVRMPLDEVALAVIRAVGPLAVTSANRSGEPAATKVEDALDQLGEAVALYLDDGPRADNVPSTIVDLTRREPHILREGALPSNWVLAVANGEVDPLDAATYGTFEEEPPITGPPIEDGTPVEAQGDATDDDG
jgi:tRNA threonylcarbamoyl adenosine modification protein (Sua5/YciO/YrdC/YwlC family)